MAFDEPHITSLYVTILHCFGDITNFTWHMIAFDFEKSFNTDTAFNIIVTNYYYYYYYTVSQQKHTTQPSTIIMVALWNRADHYIFMLWFVYGRPM